MKCSQVSPRLTVGERRTGFLDVPRELRDAIYELALVAEDPIDVFPSRVSPISSRPKGLSPALLRISRQIYNEAITVLYGLNTFRATLRAHCFKPNEFSSRSMLLHPGLPPRTDFEHPKLSFIRRVAIRLEFDHIPTLPHDPCFADGALRSLIAKASPELVLVEPTDYSAYWQTLAHMDTQWANAQTSLVVTECRNIVLQVLKYAELGSPKLVVLPGERWMDCDLQWRPILPSTSQNLHIACELPPRFATTGQFGKHDRDVV